MKNQNKYRNPPPRKETIIKGNKKKAQPLIKSKLFIATVLSKLNLAFLLSPIKSLKLFNPIKGTQLTHQLRRKKMIDKLNNANDDLSFTQQINPNGTSIKDLTKLTKTLNFRARTNNPTSGERSSAAVKAQGNSKMKINKKSPF